ncbi:MAG: LysR family transcriptional regulator [Pseudomonadota bacterium]
MRYLIKFSIRQLDVFLRTARTENISQAAEQLAMSQSAASNALKDLEGRYGVKLFDRIGKRLQLSDTGRALRASAQGVLDAAEQFDMELSGQPTHTRLSVGASLTIGNYLAVDIVADHLQRLPTADVRLHVANTEQIARGILNFELDVGLIEGEVQNKYLECIRWQDDELLVFAAPSHPLAGKSSLTDEDLLAATWILREPGSGTRQTFDRAMGGLLPDLKVFMQLEHTEAIKRAVESNLGLGCLSAVSLAPALARGDICVLPVPHRDMRRHFYFALHKQRQRGEAINEWLASCRQATSKETA